jgi:hypothetical protein
MMPCQRGRSLAAEPRSGNELAQLLMEKAAGDEKILFRLIDDEDRPRDSGVRRLSAVRQAKRSSQARRQTEIKVYAVGIRPR